MPTVTTIPLILLFVVLWHYTRGHLLCMVAFVSVFSAASALNIGMLGITPWLFVLALGLLCKFLRGHRPIRLTKGINYGAVWWIVAFLVYATWSGIAHPLLFHGVPVVRLVYEEPLAWGMSNFAQLCYLMAAAVIYFITLTYTREQMQEVLDWYIKGCVVSSCFAMYQLANAVAHVPYPSEMLYSNKAHVIYAAYKINGMWRLNSTFCEASEMAGFLTVGLALVGWKLITQPLRLGRVCAFVLMLISLLMTVSSVGYVCLGYIALCSCLLYAHQVIRQGGLSPAKAVASLLLVLTATAVFTTLPEAREAVSKVVQSTLLEKQNTDSYRNRTLTHVAAVATLEKTYYMGAGWGSARASGLLYVLLSTVGLPGLLLFVGFVIFLCVPLFRGKPATPAGRKAFEDQPYGLSGTPRQDQFEQSLFGLSVLLLALIVAGSEPVDPMLWVLFGIATAAREPFTRRLPVVQSSPTPYFTRHSIELTR